MERSMGRVGLLTLALVPLLAGCRTGPPGPGGATPAAVPVGSSSQTIVVDGRQRSFRVYRPRLLAGPAPLVVMLHGGFGDARQAESAYGWDAQADTGHFLVAYPDGLDHAWAVGGGCCGTPGSTGVDDVSFIGAVVSTLGRRVPVDPARVYATGMSNGALMAYRLACDTALFAAVGPVAGSLLGACPSPAPVSVIHIHGTADRNIPYRGGTGDGVAHISGPAVPDLVARWRAVDGCAAPVTTTAGAVTTSVADCPGGRSVELITVAGAGHQWPGSRTGPVQRLVGVDPPSTALDATPTIWRFFTNHRRQG